MDEQSSAALTEHKSSFCFPFRIFEVHADLSMNCGHDPHQNGDDCQNRRYEGVCIKLFFGSRSHRVLFWLQVVRRMKPTALWLHLPAFSYRSTEITRHYAEKTVENMVTIDQLLFRANLCVPRNLDH